MSSTDSLEHKESEWTRVQQQLAKQVYLPLSECALPRRTENGSCEGDGRRLDSFRHTDFQLPWTDLVRLLSSSGVLTRKADEAAPSSSTSSSIVEASSQLPNIVVDGWSVNTRSHYRDADTCCWAAQLLHDVASQRHVDSAAASSSSPPPLAYIGGIDISCVPNTNIGVACLSVLHYPSLEICHQYMDHCVLAEPYISGFLAFREVEPVMALFAKVRGALEAEGRLPQLLFIDGCGVHHPRRCGLASHLGVLLGIPTIGCAKKMLVVGELTRESVEARVTAVNAARAAAQDDITASSAAEPSNGGSVPMPKRKNQTPPAFTAVPPLAALVAETPDFLRSTQGPLALYGYALQTSPSVKKCIFVSPGTRVGYAMAAALVLLVSRHRVPEPIRAADLGSRQYIRETFATVES